MAVTRRCCAQEPHVPSRQMLRDALWRAIAAGRHFGAADRAVAAFDAERARRVQLRLDDVEDAE